MAKKTKERQAKQDARLNAKSKKKYKKDISKGRIDSSGKLTPKGVKAKQRKARVKTAIGNAAVSLGTGLVAGGVAKLTKGKTPQKYNPAKVGAIAAGLMGGMHAAGHIADKAQSNKIKKSAQSKYKAPKNTYKKGVFKEPMVKKRAPQRKKK